MGELLREGEYRSQIPGLQEYTGVVRETYENAYRLIQKAFLSPGVPDEVKQHLEQVAESYARLQVSQLHNPSIFDIDNLHLIESMPKERQEAAYQEANRRKKLLIEQLVPFRFSARTRNAILDSTKRFHEFTDIDQLRNASDEDILALRGCGKKTLREIREKLGYPDPKE